MILKNIAAETAQIIFVIIKLKTSVCFFPFHDRLFPLSFKGGGRVHACTEEP